MTGFQALFQQATANEPYPYQTRLATEPWPDMLNIPTGLGKTAAVTLAWIFKRGYRAEGERQPTDPDTPRRLVMCLPMRVLVEQQRSSIERWLTDLGIFGRPGEGKVSVHLLMGGSEDVRRPKWTDFPEEEAVLIGTQDMLLSRALMRGYGMSRYQWPVHFALLHTDSLWVFDEVQLMGAALPTTTQLEAFRRDERIAPYFPARSLWMSATQRPEWLDTVDFRQYVGTLTGLGIDERDRVVPAVSTRIRAHKVLRRTSSTLDIDTAKQHSKSYLASLADEVLGSHVPGTQTLVIINRVERAQRLAELLAARAPEIPRLLLHSRFRPAERRAKERLLSDENEVGNAGRVVVATQAIEAGVDISSQTLFTELAPWASLVQRFGRCNRRGEYDQATVWWIDIAGVTDEALPYEADILADARERLRSLDHVDPDSLPTVDDARPPSQVLRRRDLFNLFNTDPDLAGYDVDVSPYIRDAGIPTAHVYWRDFDEVPDEDFDPDAEELCPVSVGQLRQHIEARKVGAWHWDALLGHFVSLNAKQVRPGITVLFQSGAGGYDRQLGFVPGKKEPVDIVAAPTTNTDDSYDDDSLTCGGSWVSLLQHLSDAKSAADQLCHSLGMADPLACAIVTAAARHDVGKAHPAFQEAMRSSGGKDAPSPPEDLAPWAKSPYRRRLIYAMPPGDDGDGIARPHFRHELASTLVWLDHDADIANRSLIAYIVAAHHGRVRMSLRALPGEMEPPDGFRRLFARGIWDGDALPAVDTGDEMLPPSILHLDLMQLGGGEMEPSWTDLAQRLLEEYGPFRLAWLESLLRVADWRASAIERPREEIR